MTVVKGEEILYLTAIKDNEGFDVMYIEDELESSLGIIEGRERETLGVEWSAICVKVDGRTDELNKGLPSRTGGGIVGAEVNGPVCDDVEVLNPEKVEELYVDITEAWDWVEGEDVDVSEVELPSEVEAEELDQEPV
jgi:hypothetical protein